MDGWNQPAEAIYHTRAKKDCRRLGLVLEALGVEYEVHENAGEFALVVAAADAARARAELHAYSQEDRGGPTGEATLAQPGGGWGGVVGYATVLIAVAVIERQSMFDRDWSAAGMAHAGLILNGEWWRAVTALTLHGDLTHLAANLAIGGLFGLFAGKLLGSGLAWSSILIAGTTGNLLNALIRDPAHTSIGASTAVFATLGLMAAVAWQRRRSLQTSKLARWSPIVGGVVLLSLLGTGGLRTDVAAHVTGFFAGVVLGALYGKLGDRVLLTAKTQLLMGLGALAALALAWVLALAPGAR